MSENDRPPSSTRPYLIRAIRDWAVDNGFTPHILVDAALPGVRVPAAYVKDGQITLNIDERAVQLLEMSGTRIAFNARFRGISQLVEVPVEAVLAIFARENGQGIFFQAPGEPAGPSPAAGEPAAPEKRPKPSLKLVK
jgi:stringent starvation protein B